MDDDATFELLGLVLSNLDTQLTMRDSLVAGNRARGTDGGQGIGGGVYLEGGTARKERSLILGNFASTGHHDLFGLFV